jgi:hypothetical protein
MPIGRLATSLSHVIKVGGPLDFLTGTWGLKNGGGAPVFVRSRLKGASFVADLV